MSPPGRGRSRPPPIARRAATRRSVDLQFGPPRRPPGLVADHGCDSGATTQVSSTIRMPGIESALQERLLQPRGGDLPGPCLFHPSTTGATQPIPFCCVCQHADDAAAARRSGRVRRPHTRGLPNGFRRTTALAGDHRSRRRLRDRRCQALRRPGRGRRVRHGMAENIARCVVLGQLVPRERRRRRSRDRRRLRGPQAVGATRGTWAPLDA